MLSIKVKKNALGLNIKNMQIYVTADRKLMMMITHTHTHIYIYIYIYIYCSFVLIYWLSLVFNNV